MGIRMFKYAVITVTANILLSVTALTASAQVLVAAPDSFGVPFPGALVVDSFGVLSNDTLDGANAGESGVTVTLLSSVSSGTLSCSTNASLQLCPDGSFDYEPDPTYNGIDTFTYRATAGAITSDATVTLTACTGGPDLFTCWQELSYIAKLKELGYIAFQEGFENSDVWGSVRSSFGITYKADNIISRGIKWQANHPLTNKITTSPGSQDDNGSWEGSDPDHGYATGALTFCQAFDNPPPECLLHDGLTGIREPSQSALHGAGGYVRGTTGSNIAIILDANAPVNVGKLPDPGYRFFGVIDAGVSGFTRFEFQELDGKVEQRKHIWLDNFIFAVPYGLEHALTALQIVSNIQPALRFPTAIGVDGNGAIGLGDAIHILREVAGMP